MKFCCETKLGKHCIEGFVVSIISIIIDQITKAAVLSHLADGKYLSLSPFAGIVLVWNKGISFGMFNNDTSNLVVIFIAISVIMVSVLSYWMVVSKDKPTTYSLALIIGGALGNIIDRIRFGAVVDFIDLYVSKYHWPAFNIADSCITIGACIMLFITLRYDEGKK